MQVLSVYYLNERMSKSNESCKFAALALPRIRCWIILISAAQAVTLANPFEIYLHRKQRSKKSVSKTPCASVRSVSFFDLRTVAAGSQDEL